MSVTKKVQKNIKAKQLDDLLPPGEKKWLEDHPTRLEVSNYINALWEHHYLPLVTNYIQISSMVLQAILIDKGVCTGEEIKDITEKFVSEQRRRAEMETAEDGLVGRLSEAATNLNEGKWKVSTEDEKVAIGSVLDKAYQHLVDINFNKSSTITEEEMGICADNLESIKSSINDGIIKLEDEKIKKRLMKLLTESIQRFRRGICSKSECEETNDEEPKDKGE